jgi:hypothetical protein
MVSIKEIKNSIENIINEDDKKFVATNKDVWAVIVLYMKRVSENNLEAEKQNFPALDDDLLHDSIMDYLNKIGSKIIQSTSNAGYPNTTDRDSVVREISHLIRTKFKIYG